MSAAARPLAAPLPLLLDAFARQAAWCQRLAPFSARVLGRSALWLQQDAKAAAELTAVAADPLAAAVPLRWLAGLHHLALLGLEPWVDLWPPQLPPADQGRLDEALDQALAAAWALQRPRLRAALALPPQTNEVQRSAALLPGLLHVACVTGLPLQLCEIGASAGLNLWCDHFHHAPGSWTWGDPEAGLRLSAQWQGPPPAIYAPLAIRRRAACDAMPVDLLQAGEPLRLASYIWADQTERLARLRAAEAVALRCMAELGVGVEAASAAAFVRRQLGQRREGEAFVLMHSVMWQYVDAAEQAEILASMQAAGAVAAAAAPVAWLRLEPPAPDQGVELRCRIWPGGADVLLARCHPHAAGIEWLVAAPLRGGA